MTPSTTAQTLPSWLQLPDQLDPDQSQDLERDWFEATKDHVNRLLAIGLKASNFPFVEWRSEGLYVYGPTGQRLFDCLGAGGVFGLGFRHPRVVAAVKAQLDRGPLATRMGVVPGQSVLAQKLVEVTPEGLDHVFFANSGTESVEAAIKLARLATGRSGLVGTHQGYHGMSVGTISLSGLGMWREGLGDMLASSKLVPHGNLELMEKALDDQTAAVVLEPIQWAAGCRVVDKDYFKKVKSLCERAGALLILDEIQTGLGRTGTWFCCEQFEVVPDLLCVGKVLSGGVVPVAATVYNKRVFAGEKNRAMFNNSSFGGNPLACAAGTATIEVLQDGLLERSRLLGERLEKGYGEICQQFPEVLKGQHGMGLMRCLEFSHPVYGYVFQESMRNDKNILTAAMAHIPQYVRVSPPFICGDDDLDLLIESTRQVVEQMKQDGFEKVHEKFSRVIAAAQAEMAKEG